MTEYEHKINHFGRNKQNVDDILGVSNLLASLGHTGRKRVVLGHTLNPLQQVITKKFHDLSKFTILC